jgi:putative DNA primase/helicase
MSIDEALDRACSNVGIVPPRRGWATSGKWISTDTTSGKNGKGDGRVIIDDDHATAWNWQTGEKSTVWTKEREEYTPADRKRYAEKKAAERRAAVDTAARAATLAQRLVDAAKPGTHPYLLSKGLSDEKALTISANAIRGVVGSMRDEDPAFGTGDYLIGGLRAVLVPARVGQRIISSAQLIWEDGKKRFVYGGTMKGASHRIATGTETWLCEGYATGLSLRVALAAFKRPATIRCCFSASNIVEVAKSVSGRCFVAADHDPVPEKNPDQFGGLGAGEFYARQTGLPYVMPPTVKQDFNDVHADEGTYAVQRLLKAFLQERRA